MILSKEVIVSLTIFSVALLTINNGMNYFTREGKILENTIWNRNIGSVSVGNLGQKIKDSYYIDFENTTVGNEYDQLSLYTSKDEKKKITIFIDRDPEYDLSRLAYVNQEGKIKYLHTEKVYIEKFTITDITGNPVSDDKFLENQPYIGFHIILRNRSYKEKPETDKYKILHTQNFLEIKTGYALRNYVNSSRKN